MNFYPLENYTSSEDNISTILKFNHKDFCVHTWYSRLYNIDKKHTERINKILE